MAIDKHPLTGVPLNRIEISRKSLTFDEAITAVILRQKGDSYHSVAQKLGTNTHRVGEVFRGDTHPCARQVALDILTGKPLRKRTN
ncbi:hypothetical protein [Yoonia sp. I 8.24]|uniref:hypothetical protein n=1 Tax=Yoonia sp. I 8.24 TaxID=1537229 RepID=UPI001EE0AD67|nr:hypothetical protein [Yoonia sp. I 8.24]MCG3267760.1 hypothetical protein [Yoonia sp. I 8.24]